MQSECLTWHLLLDLHGLEVNRIFLHRGIHKNLLPKKEQKMTNNTRLCTPTWSMTWNSMATGQVGPDQVLLSWFKFYHVGTFKNSPLV